MPDYKRKKVKRFSNKKTNQHKEEKITMHNKTRRSVVPEEQIKVVRGKKFLKKQKIKFISTVAVLICLFLLILSATMPGGLYDNAVNFATLIGHGSYPVSVSGNILIDSVSNGAYYYVLSDTSIAACSNNGKILFNELHGFSNPIMKVSSTRVMVYDQGGNFIHLYNLSGKINTLDTKKEIITATLADNGSIAVATHSDSNTSVAVVYDKKFNEVFKWNSAIEIINNVIFNSSGNKLALSTISVVSGQYNSKLHILNIKSDEPLLHTADLGNSLPLSLANNGRGISIVCKDKYKFLHWSKFTSNEITSSGEVNICRNTKNGLLLVFNLANNRNDNTVVIVSKKGEKKSEFKVANAITDIQFNKGRIYLLSDTTITIFNKNGKVLRYDETDYGTKKIAVTASNSVAAISDTKIIKTNIDKG